jgi:hypothetical protein
MLKHLEDTLVPTSHLAVAARADNEAIAAIGTGLGCMNTKLDTVVASLTTLQADVASLRESGPAQVAQAFQVALSGAASALAAHGHGAAAAQLLPQQQMLALMQRAHAAPPPPLLPLPPGAGDGVLKAYVDLGNLGTVKRLYEEWTIGDAQTGQAAVKDATASQVSVLTHATRVNCVPSAASDACSVIQPQITRTAKQKRRKIIQEINSVLLTLQAATPDATVEAAIERVEALRSTPPFSTTGKPCTLPQLYEGLSRRDNPKRTRTAAGDDADGEGAAGDAAVPE